MKPKKEIIVTFRTDAQTKALLDKMAEEKEWSVSQVVEKICKEYFIIKSRPVNVSGWITNLLEAWCEGNLVTCSNSDMKRIS